MGIHEVPKKNKRVLERIIFRRREADLSSNQLVNCHDGFQYGLPVSYKFNYVMCYVFGCAKVDTFHKKFVSKSRITWSGPQQDTEERNVSFALVQSENQFTWETVSSTSSACSA